MVQNEEEKVVNDDNKATSAMPDRQQDVADVKEIN